MVGIILDPSSRSPPLFRFGLPTPRLDVEEKCEMKSILQGWENEMLPLSLFRRPYWERQLTVSTQPRTGTSSHGCWIWLIHLSSSQSGKSLPISKLVAFTANFNSIPVHSIPCLVKWIVDYGATGTHFLLTLYRFYNITVLCGYQFFFRSKWRRETE